LSETSRLTLKGEKILVTGSSRGIGAGIALLCAERGAQVAVTYQSKREAAESVVSRLPGTGHLVLPLDIGSEESVESAFQQIAKTWDGLSGLVNNAGVTRDTLVLRMKTEDFDQVLQTNLRGAFLCSRAAAKVMLKARRGSIVNITSVIGQMGNAGQSNYAASKAGLIGFSKSLAQELGSRSIRVNCVAPGFIETDMTSGLSEEQRGKILSQVPLGQLGSVEDIAEATCFLLSGAARYVTGQVLGVNGGMYM
jgi:3-oxoacyl-[acyl-carrier protein] reductase